MSSSDTVLVADSTANLPADLIAQHNIRVMPLRVVWPGDDVVGLKDIVEVKPSEFFERLSSSQEFPTTAQPSPGEFVEFFAEAGKEARNIIAVLVSEKLSGTIRSAEFALNMVDDLNIEIVDTKNVSLGAGMIVMAAARAIEQGKDAGQVATIARDSADRTRSWFVVDTLEYLHRGGRVSSTKKMIGSMLNMKPLLHVVDGNLELFGTVRTMKKAVATMLDIIEVEVKNRKDLRMGITHALNPQLAEYAREHVQKRMKPVELIMTEMSPVIGAHTGPGALGICHLAED